MELITTDPLDIVGSGLDEVQAEQLAISDKLAKCKECRFAYDDGQSVYDALLFKVAEDLCKAIQTESFSLDQALAILPIPQSADSGLQTEKNALIRRAQMLLANPNINDSAKERVKKAISRINYTDDSCELSRLQSLVIGEIERDAKKIAPMISEYQQLHATKNALLMSLGFQQESLPSTMLDPVELKQLITKTKSQITNLETELIAQAERREIAEAIDAAMVELGYEFIGKKRADVGTSQIKLYEFSTSAGLQVTHRQDGVVRIKVVGLAAEEKMPSAEEQQALYQEQVDFCGEYDEIVAAFARHGVVMRAGTQKRNPAHIQFCQFVNVTDYDPSYFADAALSTSRRTVKKAKRKPKLLSKS